MTKPKPGGSLRGGPAAQESGQQPATAIAGETKSTLAPALPSTPAADNGKGVNTKVAVEQLLDSEFSAEFTCKVCLVHIVGNGPMLTRCSHLFCGDCIVKWLESHPTYCQTWAQRAQGGGTIPCPVCKEPLNKDRDLFKVGPDSGRDGMALWGLISQLKVVCAKHPKVTPGGQCQWVGEAGNYAEHARHCKALLNGQHEGSSTSAASAEPDEISDEEPTSQQSHDDPSKAEESEPAAEERRQEENPPQEDKEEDEPKGAPVDELVLSELEQLLGQQLQLSASGLKPGDLADDESDVDEKIPDKPLAVPEEEAEMNMIEQRQEELRQKLLEQQRNEQRVQQQQHPKDTPQRLLAHQQALMQQQAQQAKGKQQQKSTAKDWQLWEQQTYLAQQQQHLLMQAQAAQQAQQLQAQFLLRQQQQHAQIVQQQRWQQKVQHLQEQQQQQKRKQQQQQQTAVTLEALPAQAQQQQAAPGGRARGGDLMSSISQLVALELNNTSQKDERPLEQRRPEARGPAPPAKKASSSSGGQRAIAAFTATEPTQLAIEIGDAIEVIEKHTSGWTYGRLSSRDSPEGWFPSWVLWR
mmetsp:Transcript_18519/g.43356  ORF Transcript_18519/g.43356 Transcript_18519/m.43356 type:complete len:581 (+) Transcript_18519:96-1838(+)